MHKIYNLVNIWTVSEKRLKFANRYPKYPPRASYMITSLQIWVELATKIPQPYPHTATRDLLISDKKEIWIYQNLGMKPGKRFKVIKLNNIKFTKIDYQSTIPFLKLKMRVIYPQNCHSLFQIRVLDRSQI